MHAQAGTRPEVVLAPWGTWRGDLPTEALAVVDSLAAARRAGLEASSAPYVRFLEATDTVPADATRVLLAALEGSSASAAGVSERIDATWRDRAHAVAPEAALDVAARLFRASDEVRSGLDFDPGHGRWADATLARLDRVAAAVPVPDVVHHDHHREHGLPFGHLPRRAGEVQTLTAAVADAAEEVDPELAGAWAAGLLDRRLPSLVEDVESFDAETWDALRRTTRRLLALAALEQVRVEARLQAWLVAEGRRDEVTSLVVSRWREPDDVPTSVTSEGGVLADLGVPAPPEVLTLHERETPLWATVRHAHAYDGETIVDLVVLARGVPSTPDDQVTLRLSGQTFEAAPSGDERADRIAAETWTDHRSAGWRLRVPEVDLAAGGAVLEYRSGPVVRRGPLPEIPAPASGGRGGGPRLVGVEWAGETATLAFSKSGQVTVSGPGGEVSGATDGDGTVVLRLSIDPWGLGERPLPLGVYEVRLDDREVVLADDLVATSVELVGDRHRLVVRANGNGAARLALEDLRGADEVGPGAQHRLQVEYAASTAPVDPTLAYFQSYTGQQPTDSPLVIFESLRRQRPDIRVQWGVDDPGVPVPEGAEPVLLRSREWYDTLARAGWIVTNIEMERWFRRRPDQQLLQTWHGNPGKVMGLGLWRANGLTPGRIERSLEHGPRNWTLLMSPSPEMTGHYRREFDYIGPVVEQGYARDDPLVAPSAVQLRAEARDRLGIAGDQTAVLYAPTWRDTMATNFRAARLHDDLDLADLAAALGPSYVVLLRGHRFHARHPDRPTGARILDVTDYPEINHLVLAADVAVLDYSSLRFDVGVVGLPMVFMVPDLAAYEESRGFLFDFRSSAPGPLLATTGEVVASLRDLESVRADYATMYAEFRARFHAGQDGHAADRAVEAFFGSV